MSATTNPWDAARDALASGYHRPGAKSPMRGILAAVCAVKDGFGIATGEARMLAMHVARVHHTAHCVARLQWGDGECECPDVLAAMSSAGPDEPAPEPDEVAGLRRLLDARLVYVRSGFAHFAGDDFRAGDGWHRDWRNVGGNAGPPAADIVVGFSGAFDEPDEGLSVDAINAGRAPWLWAYSAQAALPAGATVAEFVRFVRDAGGEVYLPAGQAAELMRLLAEGEEMRPSREENRCAK